MSGGLPGHASVVVIGGGVMGCSTLYHLARQGISDAVLLERNQLTSGTTWHSAAQVRALRSSRNLTDLIRYSIDLYSTLEQETGQATGWINKGSLSIATNPDRMVHIRRQEALAQMFGVQAETITAGEALERWPHMNADDVVGAVWSPDDGRVSPSDLCAALVKGARSRGAKIFEHTSVLGMVTRDGRIVAIETDKGSIKCDAVAVCAGLWSRKTAAMGGAEVPVWPCEHFYLLTKPVDGISGNLPTLSDHDNHLYIRDDSGGLLVGCFEPTGKPVSPDALGENFAFQLLDEDWDHFEPMMINALHRLPVLEKAEVRMLLNGPESFTPDGSFMLGESAETAGLFLGCGMNSVGVATGGGAGMALAHCIEHGAPPMDLHEADPKRFAREFNSVEALTSRVPEVLGKHYEITYPGRQWCTARNLKELPLNVLWREHGARFGQFGAWERPLYFGAPQEPELTFGKPQWHQQVGVEVEAAHRSAALFDLSSFGKIEVSGPEACKFLNRVCSNQMNRPVGRAVYTAMLNEKGGIESDLTGVRLSEERYMLSVGTTALKRDLAWLRRHAGDDNVQIRDVTDEYVVLGLMGPDAHRVAQAAGTEAFDELKYFQSGEFVFHGRLVRATRLSYVGEAGWEITCRAADAVDICNVLLGNGARPAGLFAQSSMRIEKRFLAYGHELDMDFLPIEAGLDFAIDWEKEFVGHTALREARSRGTTNRIFSIVFEDRDAVPIGNEPVMFGQEIIGKTTSASFGYRVNAPVALADFSMGTDVSDRLEVEVNIAGSRYRGRIVARAVFDPEGRRMRSATAT